MHEVIKVNKSTLTCCINPCIACEMLLLMLFHILATVFKLPYMPNTETYLNRSILWSRLSLQECHSLYLDAVLPFQDVDATDLISGEVSVLRGVISSFGKDFSSYTTPVIRLYETACITLGFLANQQGALWIIRILTNCGLVFLYACVRHAQVRSVCSSCHINTIFPQRANVKFKQQYGNNSSGRRQTIHIKSRTEVSCGNPASCVGCNTVKKHHFPQCIALNPCLRQTNIGCKDK